MTDKDINGNGPDHPDYRILRGRNTDPELRAPVTLFKKSGKYYTTESWRIPEGAIGPFDMADSPDFRRISGGPVLIEDDASPRNGMTDLYHWGFPALIL